MVKLAPLFILILILGCTAKQEDIENLPALPINSRDFKIGVAGLVWQGYPSSSAENFQSLLAELPSMGEYVGLYINWNDPGLMNQINLIKQHSNVQPLIALGFEHRLVNDSYFEIYSQDYKNKILEVVESNDLDYLAIGVEVNRLYDEISPKAFNDFVIFYKDVYDAVKLISPETKIYTIFQLDTLRGEAYLTGLNLNPKWELIDEFEDKLDLVGLTIYPFLNYSTIDRIPLNYFSEINNYISKPLMITESGWLSEPLIFNGEIIINASEEEQKNFVIKLINSTQILNVEVLMYSFLYEAIQEVELFNTVALRKNSGPEKEAYYYWRALKELSKI